MLFSSEQRIENYYIYSAFQITFSKISIFLNSAFEIYSNNLKSNGARWNWMLLFI